MAHLAAEQYDKVISLAWGNTWWLNYIFFADGTSRGPNVRCSIIAGRFGYHRYQIGFAGDALISWRSLAYQPHFQRYGLERTPTDIEPGYRRFPRRSDRSAFYVRWMQFGAFSPIMRVHSTKNEHLNKEPWKA